LRLGISCLRHIGSSRWPALLVQNAGDQPAPDPNRPWHTVLGCRAKRRLESLSRARLQVADDFLAYLQERESNEATEELLRVPGFEKGLAEAEKQIEAGQVIPAERLGRKS